MKRRNYYTLGYPMPEEAGRGEVAPRGPRILFWIVVGAVLLAFAFGLASCATKGPVRPVSAPLTAPAKVEKADLAPAEARAAEVGKSNAVAAEKVGRISRELSGLKIELRDATAAADRLVRQKSATEAELADLWRKLTAFEGAADRAESEAAAAKVALDDQRTISEALVAELSRARTAVEAKNWEAEGLRLTLADTEALRANAAKAATDNADLAAVATADKEKLAGEIRIYRWIAGVAAALGVLFIVIKAVKPV